MRSDKLLRRRERPSTVVRWGLETREGLILGSQKP